MNHKSIVLTTIMAIALVWAGCNKDEKNVEPPAPDNEVITTVKLIAINAADTTDVQTAQWKDLTPNDGNPDLTQAMLTLKKNAVYNVSVSFLDETKTPADNVTEEVLDRANYHLICYTPSAGLNLSVQRTDHDTNTPQLELGLQTKFTTTAISSGTLEVALHHQPSGKNGTDCSIGSTDADVNFSITIE